MNLQSVLREKEYSNEDLLISLQEDPVGRNQQLNTFIGLLNSIEKNAVLTIDGAWGSGKTIFVRQLEYLNKLNIEKITLPHISNIEEFQEEFVTYYYNAWENDFHHDPMQSLLFNLINDFWSKTDKAGDKFVKVSKGLGVSVVKTLTAGLVNVEDINKIENISGLVKGITTADDRKKAINDIIDNYLDLKGKKLLFIVDELDRCKPTFAVNLLESIKHYFTNDKIVFLMSTNNKELSHTIKKVYGESFDGTGYLSKFYDLVFNLPELDSKSYIKYLGGYTRSAYYSDEIPLEVASHLEMSMREINRYYSSLKLIESYLTSEGGFSEHHYSAQLVKYVFIPFAYGLRIQNLNDYHNFVKGKGEDLLTRFCEDTRIATRIAQRGEGLKNSGKESAVEEIIKVYLKVTADLKENGDSYDILESKENFKRVVLLMNSSGSIDEKDNDNLLINSADV